jgi:hypothetical protein
MDDAQAKWQEPDAVTYLTTAIRVWGPDEGIELSAATWARTHAAITALLDEREALRVAALMAYEALLPLHNAHLPSEREGLTDDDVEAAQQAVAALRGVLLGDGGEG